MNIAVIVAAGKGVRMNGTVKKQYLQLAGRPILSHTLLAFDTCPFIDDLYLVTPEEDMDYCKQRILGPLDLSKRVQLVRGGPERQDSVFNGLLAVNERRKKTDESSDLAVIHDGVRPFVTADQISESIKTARVEGACIFAIPAHDTLKRTGDSGYVESTIERNTIWLAQTPQTFQYDLIMKAHQHANRTGYRGTDDASLVEQLDQKVKILPGSPYNIKITRQADLRIAEAIYTNS